MILSGILHASLGGFTVIRGVAPLGACRTFPVSGGGAVR